MKILLILFFCFITSPGSLRAQDDDEQIIQDLEKDRKKSTAAAVQMNDMSENLKHQFSTIPEKLKNLGVNRSDLTSLLDEKTIHILKKSLKENPLKKLPKEEVRGLILEKIQNQTVKKFLGNSPKILNTMVEILQDENALPSAVGIFLRKSDLKLYGFIWLGLLILSWFFKKIFFSRDWTFGYRIIMSLCLSLSVSAISLGIFYTMFYDELSPSVNIMIKSWRRRNL